MKRLVPIAIALSLTVLLASVALAQESIVRLSDAPDGSAMTQFPSGAAVVYAIFDWTGFENIQTEYLNGMVYMIFKKF